MYHVLAFGHLDPYTSTVYMHLFAFGRLLHLRELRNLPLLQAVVLVLLDGPQVLHDGLLTAHVTSIAAIYAIHIYVTYIYNTYV